MNSSRLVHVVCTNKVLKKLALCLTVSICASNCIVQSTENVQSVGNQEENNTDAVMENIENIRSSIRAEMMEFNRLNKSTDCKNYINWRKKFTNINKQNCYSEEVVRLIIEAYNYFNENDSIIFKFSRIFFNLTGNMHDLATIRDTDNQNDNIKYTAQNILDKAGQIARQSFYIWLLENELNGFRNKLIELSKEIATINKVRNEIDSKLIDEMNKVINAMLKYKSEILC